MGIGLNLLKDLRKIVKSEEWTNSSENRKSDGVDGVDRVDG